MSNNVISKSSFGPPSTSHNQPTTVDDNHSTNKNLSKLEEVLRRQRERLDSMSGSFNPQASSSNQQQQHLQASIEDQN